MTDQQPAKVVLEPESATELVDLLSDNPGDADERLLDEAREALTELTTKIATEDQREVGRGELVALQVDPEEVDVAIDLIDNNTVKNERLARRLADRLRARVLRARKRQEDR